MYTVVSVWGCACERICTKGNLKTSICLYNRTTKELPVYLFSCYLPNPIILGLSVSVYIYL